MEVLAAQLINGLAVGSMYALGVTGFNLLMLVSGVVQYAYPHLVVLAMYVAWLVLKASGDNLLLAIPAAIAAATILSMATEPLFRPLARRGAANHSLVLAVGLAMILTHVMAKHLNNGMPIAFPKTLSSNEAVLSFGVAAVSTGQLLTFATTFAAVAVFMILLYRTMLGRAFRAMAQAPFVARLLGVPVFRTAMGSYAIAGFLGGITAVCLAMALGTAYPSLGDALALKIIATVLFAGAGNLKGGLVCGLILGVAESLTTGYLSGQWANAVAFGMILAVVFFRPQGLFGVRT
jgi:branched-chain amino acid transport system permease protein